MINIDATRGLDLTFKTLNEIYVIDNLFPEWFIEYVHAHTIWAPAWLFGRTSGDNTGELPAFSQQIFPPNAVNADNNCFDMMYQALSKTLPPHNLTEIVVNGQQSYHDTVFHQDCEDDAGLTFIYYVNKDYNPEWGGGTAIEYDNVTTVDFVPGRVALFKGKYYHKGCSFVNSPELRTTVAIKVALL